MHKPCDMSDLFISRFLKTKEFLVTTAVFLRIRRREVTANWEFVATLFPRNLIRPITTSNRIRLCHWKFGLSSEYVTTLTHENCIFLSFPLKILGLEFKNVICK